MSMSVLAMTELQESVCVCLLVCFCETSEVHSCKKVVFSQHFHQVLAHVNRWVAVNYRVWSRSVLY